MDILSLSHPQDNPLEHITKDCACAGKRCKHCQEIRCIDFFRKGKDVTSTAVKGKTCIYCRRTYNHAAQIKHREKLGIKPRQLKPLTPSTPPITAAMLLTSITQADYETALTRQGGVCAICKRSEEPHPVTGRSLYVDHDHDTNKFRGLLCNSCNIRLGRIERNKQFYLDALAYLDKP